MGGGGVGEGGVASACEMAGCRSGSAASSVVVHFGRDGRSSGLSPPASEGTISTGITGYQGPTGITGYQGPTVAGGDTFAAPRRPKN